MIKKTPERIPDRKADVPGLKHNSSISRVLPFLRAEGSDIVQALTPKTYQMPARDSDGIRFTVPVVCDAEDNVLRVNGTPLAQLGESGSITRKELKPDQLGRLFSSSVSLSRMKQER